MSPGLITVQSLVSDVTRGRTTRRQALAAAAAAGIALPGLAAIAGQATAQDATPNPNAKRGGTLRVALQADPAELDPHLILPDRRLARDRARV